MVSNGCSAKIKQCYVSLLRLIFIHKMFFFIESGYIMLVCKDYKINGTLESVMLINSNLTRAAWLHMSQSCWWRVKTPQSPFELVLRNNSGWRSEKCNQALFLLSVIWGRGDIPWIVLKLDTAAWVNALKVWLKDRFTKAAQFVQVWSF